MYDFTSLRVYPLFFCSMFKLFVPTRIVLDESTPMTSYDFDDIQIPNNAMHATSTNVTRLTRQCNSLFGS